MKTPVRLQRRRVRDWRAPIGSVYVGRPTRWGNPFETAEIFVKLQDAASFGRLPKWGSRLAEVWARGPSVEFCATVAVTMYDDLLRRLPEPDLKALLRPLVGRDLMCWCGTCAFHRDGLPAGIRCLDCLPCHADVLLKRTQELFRE